MCEKRFTIKPQDDYWAVVDNYNDDKVCIVNGIHTEIEAIWLCDLLNEQDRKINVLQNSCEIMNQRLSEKSKCNYKKAIIEFCKFMNINTPLLEVMVDEFLQEVF